MFQQFARDLWPGCSFSEDMIRDLVRLYMASIFAGATVFSTDENAIALAEIDEVGQTMDEDFSLDGWKWT
jgi:TolB-like protein